MNSTEGPCTLTERSRESLNLLFNDILGKYPATYHPILEANRHRILWQVDVVVDNVREGGNLVDIGAGIVPFMLISQELGYRTTVIDDLEDSTYLSDASKRVIELFESSGVNFIQADAFTNDLSFLTDLDLVTSHDSMEHWHHSPRNMFRKFWARMTNNGLFFLGVPNCVNLRKRITVPFDLRYIARDLGASRHQILGRNWIGYRHSSALIRRLTPLVDRAMQLRPSICSDIYLLAWKSGK